MLATTLKGVIAQTLLKRKAGRGRVAALEVLLGTSAVASYIREGKSHQIPMAMQTGGKLGMVELQAALMKLVREDLVTPEEAWAKAVDKEGIVRECVRHAIPIRVPGSEPGAEAEEPAARVSPAPSAPARSSASASGVIQRPVLPPGAAATAPMQRAPATAGAPPGAVPAAALAVDVRKRGGWFG
jgi:hypothetical protein